MLSERPARRRRGPGLTPLIDVVFLLLVFFMLASRYDRESSLPLAVRSAPTESRELRDDSGLRIELDAAGAARLDGRTLDRAALTTELARAARAGDGVRVRPHPETRLQPIVDLLALASELGVGTALLEQALLERSEPSAPGEPRS